MKMIFDPTMMGPNRGGRAFVGTDAFDYLRKAVEATKTATGYKIVNAKNVKVNYPGRQANNLDQLLDLIRQPWPEATSLIDRFIEEVAKFPLPEPHDVRRKNKWNDEGGELDETRALIGEPEMYRRAFRKRIKAPTSIVLLCNLDIPSNCNYIGVFFRSIVAIVLADLLESKGYSVEIWAWCAGHYVFNDPNDGQFNALQIKRSDQPLDKDNLCNILSAWFTKYGIWASWNYQASAVSLGGMIAGLPISSPKYWDPDAQPERLKRMMRHIETEEANAQVFLIPQIFNSDTNYGMTVTKVPVTRTRRVKDENGEWKRTPKGRYVREKYTAYVNKVVYDPDCFKKIKTVEYIVDVCRDVLREIVDREDSYSYN